MQKFTITLTLTEDMSDPATPDLRIKSDADGVDDTHFALVAGTLKDLVIGGLESKLQVAVNLAEMHRAASRGGFDEEEA